MNEPQVIKSVFNDPGSELHLGPDLFRTLNLIPNPLQPHEIRRVLAKLIKAIDNLYDSVEAISSALASSGGPGISGGDPPIHQDDETPLLPYDDVGADRAGSSEARGDDNPVPAPSPTLVSKSSRSRRGSPEGA